MRAGLALILGIALQAENLPTPVVVGDYVYALGNRGTGVLNVYHALTGETVYHGGSARERAPAHR